MRITKKIYKVLSLTALLCIGILTSACGNSARFEISGKVKGAGSQTLMFVYSDGEKVFTESTTMKEGFFTFFGSSEVPTIVEVQNSAGMLIGRLIIRNGESVDCDLNINDHLDITVKGNEPSELWTQFITTNSKALRSGDTKRINALVESFVKAHPASYASTALMLTEYNSIDNEPATLKLFESIDINARPATMTDGYYSLLERVAQKALKAEARSFNLPGREGKAVHFNASLSPRSLLCFTDRDSRRDSIRETIAQIFKANSDQRRRRLIEVSFDTDTLTFRRSLSGDSARWDRCWAAGAAANPAFVNLAIPRLPYFIVVDSAGTQLYRGISVSEARSIFEMTK